MTKELAPLYVVPTPLGNLKDISERAREILAAVPWVAAEDTRHSGPLLKHLGSQARLLAAHEHNEAEAAQQILARLEAGEAVALVSDAGTPGISDPGGQVLAAALAAGFEVDALPGPNALIPALLLSGLDPRSFLFVGFLEGRPAARRRRVRSLADRPETLIFYLSPHHPEEDLALWREELGDRPAAVVREISKVHQEALRGTLGELLEAARGGRLRGELVGVVAGAEPPENSDVSDSLWQEEALRELEEGGDWRAVVKSLGERYGIPKNRAKAFLWQRRGEESRNGPA